LEDHQLEVKTLKKSAAPLIGIPCYQSISGDEFKEPIYGQDSSYMEAITQAGGIPFLIPLNLETPALRQLYESATGILLAGGGDIEPARYNQAPFDGVTLSHVQPARDQAEITLSRWAAAEGKPTLAICRGIQVLAVSAGGSLYQDLPLQRPEATLHHYAYIGEGSNAADYLAHEVTLEPTSRLAQVLQSRSLWTNSLHHQAIKDVPAPLKIVGCSSDGVIEAIEIPGHPFFVGVQWHPEMLLAKQEAARQIFAAFVAVCTA
jgi:putative glutamine amidotransferase